MRILILNFILYTADNNIIPKVKSIKDTMIYNMCLGFKQLGHRVTLGAAEDFRPIEREDYDFDVIFFKTNYKRVFPSSVLPYSCQLRKYLKENQEYFDLVISSEIFSFISLYAARICSQKTIIWHELALHQRKFHKIPSKIWYNIIARMFMRKPLVVGRSVSARNFVKQYHEFTSDECVEHGINVSKFHVNKNKEDFFIVVSQLIKRKNIPSIIQKFKELIEATTEYKDFKLYVIGRGPQESELIGLINNLNLQRNVYLTGFLSHEQMQKYIGGAKALLIDTLQDNNMVSIPETLACGTPIVTNSIPTNSYVIKDNNLGIVKEQWGVEELKDIINRNSFYVANCIKYRDKLTNTHSAQMLIDIFNNKR